MICSACRDSRRTNQGRRRPIRPHAKSTVPILLTLIAALLAGTSSSRVPAQPVASGSGSIRPVYDVSLRLRPDESVVRGEMTALFVPDLATDRLVLRLWPNSPKASGPRPELTIADVRVDGFSVAPTLPDPTTAVVTLSTPVVAGTTVRISLRWSLRVPGARRDRISRSGGSMRLGTFLPLLAWEPGVGWNLTPPTITGAEASMFPAADMVVRIDAGPHDVLATGVRDDGGAWRAAGVRDFALSVGRFMTATAVAHAPNPVQVTVAATAGLAATDPPRVYLARIVAALEAHSRRYGPYPWPVYSVAITPMLSGGIEYPMHVMQGPGSLGRTTSHEVAHQWFYALVGNDQGRDPWMDEGLASWAEARYEGSLSAFVGRTIPAVARGQASQPMSFWDRNYTAYYRGVYVQPVQALARLGSPDDVDAALRTYVERHAFKVATARDLTAVLLEAFPAGAPVLARHGLL